MSSQGGGNNGGTQTQIQNQDLISNPLTRQGSLYNLTLDEVQNQLGDLGKPLSSMNLDELLNTVWTAEANGQPDENVVPGPTSEPGQPSSTLPLNRQSSLTLSRDLSKKTVDEVWQNIQQESRSSLDRKATLGEITLEDFLVKAGVVAESVSGKTNSVDSLVIPQQAQWMNYQIPSPFSHHAVQHPISLGGNPTMDGSYPEMSPSSLMGTLSDTQTPGRKRFAPGDVAEKSVERRQKRMIKNRESAARSRARKEAYTHELENKVSRLEEENERLKRQKEWETVLPAIPQPLPKYQLRRTNSGPI